LVEEVKAFRTSGGALFASREAALRAERGEDVKNFEIELREGLHVPLTVWGDIKGEAWSSLLYSNPMLLNKLYNKYQRL
jgi:hypothetical protein